MTPPPADELVPRLFLGPALRAQSDQRLVRLVRDGYEAAFDEIMRRYAPSLRRYAGAIVGGRAEDVTQDSFSKALQALRRDGNEIELRPWLYRIVRNTALNDLRDRNPTVVLAEGIVGQRGVAEEVERREEVAELIDRLQALPEAQRTAIVMRELEGLGHDEIATALGVSDGAARQAIHRARTALRNGVGMAVPLPLLKAMLGGSASHSAELAVGGAGAGLALKAATATVLIAGTFGAGVALHETGSRHRRDQAVHRRDATTERSLPTAGPAGRDDSASRSPARNLGPRQEDHGSELRGDDGGHSGGTHDSPGHEGPSREGPSAGGGRSGPDGGPGPGSDGSGRGEGSSGSGEGGSGSGEGGSESTSGPSEVTESNSGPGPSGDGGSSGSSGDALGSGSSGSSDPGSGDVLTGQTQPQPQEDR